MAIEKSEEQSSTDETIGWERTVYNGKNRFREEEIADDELEEAVEVKSQVSRVSKRSRKTTKASLLPSDRDKLIEKERAETGRVGGLSLPRIMLPILGEVFDLHGLFPRNGSGQIFHSLLGLPSVEWNRFHVEATVAD